MAATKLLDLSGMEEVDRQQKYKLVSQSVPDINPSTSTHGTQTHMTWEYVEALERKKQHLTTVKTDLQETVNDSELTKESLRNNMEKVKTFTGLHNLYKFIIFCIVQGHTSEKQRKSHSISRACICINGNGIK